MQVRLSSLEVYSKEQYLSRSDMWRIRRRVINTVVRVHKELDCYGCRLTVGDLWNRGVQVACGLVTDDTRIIFRSSSTMVCCCCCCCNVNLIMLYYIIVNCLQQ